MTCPKCGSSDKHFCPPSLGEPGFYLCETYTPELGLRKINLVDAIKFWSAVYTGRSVNTKAIIESAEALTNEAAELRSRAEAAEAEALAAENDAAYRIWRRRREAAESRIAELEALRDEFPAITKIVVDSAKRTATEAALRWAANDIQSHDHRVLIWDAWIRSGLKALLGEDGNA